MRIPKLLPALAVLLPVAAMAQTVLAQTATAQTARPAPAAGQGPQRLGSFGNWTAATYQEAGQKVCYAFTRASRSEGGGARQNVMLTVTHRPQGRDQVAATLGYSFARDAARGQPEVEGSVGGNELRFYGAGGNAFAQNGSAAVAAFRNGRDLVLKAPGPQGRGPTNDTFSLSGFTGAYEAISRDCPARR